MLKWYFHHYVRAAERRYGYDASYLHEMADTSLSATVRFMIMQMVAGYWRAARSVVRRGHRKRAGRGLRALRADYH
ncbi:MAG TPA: hypothetical protein VJ476_14990 [Rhizomicrobium sp.]|nr:hypothetical protein [Rhizomicrobium sp.]